MSITVHCPKGHRLVANDDNAGKTGKCPSCGAIVSIPLPHTDFLSETAILGILGASAPRKTHTAAAQGDFAVLAGSTATKVQYDSHVKLCPSCDREIDTGYHICPHCHTYISTLSDF